MHARYFAANSITQTDVPLCLVCNASHPFNAFIPRTSASDQSEPFVPICSDPQPGHSVTGYARTFAPTGRYEREDIGVQMDD